MRGSTLLALMGISAAACSDFERVKLTLQTPESVVREIESFPVARLPFFLEFPAEPRASWGDWGSAGALVSLAAGKLVNVQSAWRFSMENPDGYDTSVLGPSTQLLIESWDGFEAFTSSPSDVEDRVLLFERSPYYVAHVDEREEVEKIARSFIDKFFQPDNIQFEDLFAALRLLKLCNADLDPATKERIVTAILARRVQSKGQEGFRSIYNIGVTPHSIAVEETIFGLLCLAQLESLPADMVSAMWSSFDNVLLYQGEVAVGKPLFQYAGMAMLKDLSWVTAEANPTLEHTHSESQRSSDAAILQLLRLMRAEERPKGLIVLRRDLEDVAPSLKRKLIAPGEPDSAQLLGERLAATLSCDSALALALLAGPSAPTASVHEWAASLGEEWVELVRSMETTEPRGFWPAYHETYSHIAPLMSIGRVAISAGKDAALIVLTVERGESAGSSALFYLKLEAGGWVIAGDLLLWIS